MNNKINVITIESNKQNILKIEECIVKNILCRKFIAENNLVKIADKLTYNGDKYSSILRIETSSNMNMVLIPTLIDSKFIIDNKSKDIIITITPDLDNNKRIVDIINMIHDQFVGTNDYIECKVRLEPSYKDIRIYIDSDSTKFPLFILEKFYTVYQ